MKKRGFKASKNINLKKIDKKILKDWGPTKKDKDIIKKRLIQRIKLKPNYYRYYKEKKPSWFLINLIKQA
jgi:hypothetical protein